MFNLAKELLKEYLYKILQIPYNRTGLPISLLKYIQKNQPIVLVDIGAYNGGFTKALESYCGIHQGLLIEPMPHKIAQLKENFKNPKYQIFPYALSNHQGIVEFEVNEADFTSSILKIKRKIPELSSVNLGGNKIIKCPTNTLDNIIETTEIKEINLIKLDVQGIEHLVLEGAKKTLSKTSMIWTEVSFKPLYDLSSTFIDIYTLLNECGFKLVEIEPGFRSSEGELLQADVLFINKNVG